eukprot:m.118672 g.118672  ORF g.118672 m.118672 type:complete len:741 (-) comp28685_c2_seq2:105-2327(-)
MYSVPDPGKLSGDIMIAIHKLLDPAKNGPTTRRQWVFLHEDVYKLCAADSGDHIPALRNRFTTELQDNVLELKEVLVATHPTKFLKAYRAIFNKFYFGLEAAKQGLAHFRKGENEPNSRKESDPPKKTILGVGMELWKEHIFETFKSTLYAELSSVVMKDRNGELADISSAQDILESFIKLVGDDNNGISDTQLEIYIETFETPFLEQTLEYYTRETSLIVQTLPCTEYLLKISSRFEEEQLRGTKLLHKDSELKLRKLCEQCMISDHRDIIESNCQKFVDARDITSLQLIYKLFKNIGPQSICQILESHIIDYGTKNLALLGNKMTQTLPAQYVECMTELYQKYKALIKEAFYDDLRFSATLDTACRTVVNQGNGKCPKSIQVPVVLAKFCDDCLKTSSKHLLEKDVDEELTVLISIFKFIEDKDVFQKMYSKLLAKRLINNTSISDDAEASMISKLKQCCGYEYTSKLQTMFTDIKLSTEINSEFSRTECGEVISRSFKVLVLQTGAWPLGLGIASDFHVPAIQERSMKYFSNFYNTKHSGRKLTWLHHLSTADLSARLKSKYEFTVTTYQMGVLLLYNDHDSHTVEAIANSTSLSTKELQKTIRSLLVCKLLVAEPAAPPTAEDIPNDSTLSINLKYSNKKKKVKITNAVRKDAVVETNQTNESVFQDRKNFLFATVVRVMKSRRTLAFNLLVNEVIAASSNFKPTITNIKRAIEDLIVQEYLRRNKANLSELEYLA